MKTYQEYNREERNLCSHLFRLLHHNLEQGLNSPLGAFIAKSLDKEFHNLKPDDFKSASIFSEVALLRDAVKVRNGNIAKEMDQIVEIVAECLVKQEVTKYSELPKELSTTKTTHPRQLGTKVKALNEVSEATKNVYNEVASIFNAKPDLCICIGNYLLVYEAKFTEGFKKKQMKRTKLITKVWKKVFYQDLGFDKEPETHVIKLGAEKYNPKVSWQYVLEIAKEVYSESDRSKQSFESAVNLLKR